MRIRIDRILDHPSVLAEPGDKDLFGENEALDALRQLRMLGQEARQAAPGQPDHGARNRWLPAFGHLAFDRQEREMLLTAYALRTRFLPLDLALLLETFVEQDCERSGPHDEAEYRRIVAGMIESLRPASSLSLPRGFLSPSKARSPHRSAGSACQSQSGRRR